MQQSEQEEPRRFSSRPTEVGDFWHDADLDTLERDADAASSPLVKHILMTNIEAERARRGQACIDGFSEEIQVITRRPDPMH